MTTCCSGASFIDPSNHSRRQDRSAEVTRRNLEWLLNGHPDAVPLFA
jgi:hypothetical protein